MLDVLVLSMRNRIIINDRADELHYEIREIVSVAKEVEQLGQNITWENIGDPVQKGEHVQAWIKKIIEREVQKDESYAYAHSKGILATREFLAKFVNRRKGIKITPEDICFFNGLGDAIGKIYGLLDASIRVIGPTPAYSTHSSAEAANAGAAHLTYKLDPENCWYPDLEDLELKVKYNPNITGILVINPNNPTGAVYPKEILEGIVTIARKYDVFIIADEIYINLSYGKRNTPQLSDIIGDVPGISMKGISKEFPWPGSRCGWLEFYNTGKDETFDRYVKAIIDSKMLEVASTTLPQLIIPKVLADMRYARHLASEREKYKKRAELAYKMLHDISGVSVVKPEGAFYMVVVFDEGVLKPNPARGEARPLGRQELKIKNQGVRKFIRKSVSGEIPLDKRFVYYLLGATGVCVVPLTGFESSLHGFRMTLLEDDKAQFVKTLNTIREGIREYLAS